MPTNDWRTPKISNNKKHHETIDQWLARNQREAEDTARTLGLLRSVAPLLEELDDVGFTEPWLKDLTEDEFDAAILSLLKYIQSWNGTETHAKIVRECERWAARNVTYMSPTEDHARRPIKKRKP